MGTIYVDTLICVNLFIDYIILYTVRKLLKINSGPLRLLMASIAGAFFTLGVFLPFYTRLFSVIYRTVTALAVVLIAFGKCNLLKLFVRAGAFIGISIGFSGAVTLIWRILKPRGIVVWGDAVYLDISPVMLILCTLISFISLTLYERIKEKLHPSVRIHKITVIEGNDKFTFDSMVDTGCNLKEPFSGLPVIVAEKELINKEVAEKRTRVVPYKTLSGEGMLKAFKPEKIIIDGREYKSGVYIGISEKKITSDTKSLMGKEISEGL